MEHDGVAAHCSKALSIASYDFCDTEDYAIGRQAFLDKTMSRFKGR